jgi:hypothetical protein
VAARLEDFLDLRTPKVMDRASFCGDVQVREGGREPVVMYGHDIMWDTRGRDSRREDGFVVTASIRSTGNLVSVKKHGAQERACGHDARDPGCDPMA